MGNRMTDKHIGYIRREAEQAGTNDKIQLSRAECIAAMDELIERRAQDLTSEDIASLDWCLGFIKMMRGGNDREPFNVHAERAIATLSKLLTRGNR